MSQLNQADHTTKPPRNSTCRGTNQTTDIDHSEYPANKWIAQQNILASQLRNQKSERVAHQDNPDNPKSWNPRTEIGANTEANTSAETIGRHKRPRLGRHRGAPQTNAPNTTTFQATRRHGTLNLREHSKAPQKDAPNATISKTSEDQTKPTPRALTSHITTPNAQRGERKAPNPNESEQQYKSSRDKNLVQHYRNHNWAEGMQPHNGTPSRKTCTKKRIVEKAKKERWEDITEHEQEDITRTSDRDNKMEPEEPRTHHCTWWTRHNQPTSPHPEQKTHTTTYQKPL
jgi:hypothetical protein